MVIWHQKVWLKFQKTLYIYMTRYNLDMKSWLGLDWIGLDQIRYLNWVLWSARFRKHFSNNNLSLMQGGMYQNFRGDENKNRHLIFPKDTFSKPSCLLGSYLIRYIIQMATLLLQKLKFAHYKFIKVLLLGQIDLLSYPLPVHACERQNMFWHKKKVTNKNSKIAKAFYKKKEKALGAYNKHNIIIRFSNISSMIRLVFQDLDYQIHLR